jgi:hypothetical protein
MSPAPSPPPPSRCLSPSVPSSSTATSSSVAVHVPADPGHWRVDLLRRRDRPALWREKVPRAAAAASTATVEGQVLWWLAPCSARGLSLLSCRRAHGGHGLGSSPGVGSLRWRLPLPPVHYIRGGAQFGAWRRRAQAASPYFPTARRQARVGGRASRGLPSMELPRSRVVVFLRRSSLLPGLPDPSPSLLVDAFVEWGSAILHPLSPPKAVCLPFCLCWRSAHGVHISWTRGVGFSQTVLDEEWKKSFGGFFMYGVLNKVYL